MAAGNASGTEGTGADKAGAEKGGEESNASSVSPSKSKSGLLGKALSQSANKNNDSTEKPAAEGGSGLNILEKKMTGLVSAAKGMSRAEKNYEMARTKRTYKEMEERLTGRVLFDERVLMYKTRDKFLDDLTFDVDLSVKSQVNNGVSMSEGVKPGWKLVTVNDKSVSPPFGVIMEELRRMKEKQRLYVELRNPKPLGRVKVFVEQDFN